MKTFKLSIAVLFCIGVFTYANAQTVTDIDGNVYNTVKIGKQLWMRENLKTSRYQDSTAIIEIEDSATWANIYYSNATTPAWCYYKESPSNNALYGKLYNWYVVADKHNVCPTNWHVPTDDEFQVLIDYLGGDDLAGGKMKSLKFWKTPNYGITNSSGFTVLPAGFRYNTSEFGTLGLYASFWTSTVYSSEDKANDNGRNAWKRELYGRYGDYSGCARFWTEKALGLSVRCIEDK